MCFKGPSVKYNSVNGHNFSSFRSNNVDWFSESLERGLSDDVLKCMSNIWSGPYGHFSALDPWYRQIDKYFYLSNMNFDDTIWKVYF